MGRDGTWIDEEPYPGPYEYTALDAIRSFNERIQQFRVIYGGMPLIIGRKWAEMYAAAYDLDPEDVEPIEPVPAYKPYIAIMSARRVGKLSAVISWFDEINKMTKSYMDALPRAHECSPKPPSGILYTEQQFERHGQGFNHHRKNKPRGPRRRTSPAWKHLRR